MLLTDALRSIICSGKTNSSKLLDKELILEAIKLIEDWEIRTCQIGIVVDEKIYYEQDYSR